jgi:prepilin-type N-terminal cleavage/methylation domain-containing protein
MKQGGEKSGFTLIEIIIVVGIIGLLAGIGIPKILKSANQTRDTCFIKEIQYASTAFIQYVLDHDAYPADKTPGIIPNGMAGYLTTFDWSEETTIGGQWDWDYNVFGIKAGISVHRPERSPAQMQKIDAVIDDGNLATGHFRRRSGGYIYVIEAQD